MYGAEAHGRLGSPGRNSRCGAVCWQLFQSSTDILRSDSQGPPSGSAHIPLHSGPTSVINRSVHSLSSSPRIIFVIF